jgi:hypothetical protein
MVDAWPSRKKIRATRVSFELANGGESDRSLFVMHKCDQPSCVNPAHLALGTQSENMRDKVSKGRDRSPVFQGEAHAMSKLKDADVIAIREWTGELLIPALKYNISRATVSAIRRHKTWRHLP